MYSITELLNHYGYIVLMALLMLEMCALPFPGEVLMTYCGFLVSQQKLNWLLSIIVASSGVIIGITITYFVGSRLGYKFFKRYGHYIHLGPDKLDKTSLWFNKYGNRLLIISYFIPGVRHITGYFSGTTKISYKKFALNAYIGAFLWTTTFISLGKILGKNWDKYHSMITKYLIIGGLIIASIIIVIYVYRNFRQRIINFIIRILQNGIKIFRTLGKIKFAIAGVALAFLAFCGIVIGLIEDYLSHEFEQFDQIISLLIRYIFTEKWSNIMNLFSGLTSYSLLVSLTIMLLIWIRFKGKNRILEMKFTVLAILGGEMLQFILRNIFRRGGASIVSLAQMAKYTFPSEHSFMAIVAYGFISFMIIRHVKRHWIGTACVVVTLAICLFAGLGTLFFQVEYPSDVLAGYIFGGLWLSLNIVLLEVYRILPKIK